MLKDKMQSVSFAEFMPRFTCIDVVLINGLMHADHERCNSTQVDHWPHLTYSKGDKN